uniref:Neur_chan_LBD domain-containing protein n=1 Tax=Macrostomum lignano TaxID=282301 RepID=A0A1I8FD75_9PLAT
DAGYHAVDTDDDCQSNASGEFNSTEFLNARDEPEDPQLLQQQLQQPHYRRQPAPAQAACRGLRNRGLLRAASSSAATAEAALSDRDAVVTTSFGPGCPDSALPPSATVDPGPVSLDPTQRLIDALETLRDSINDSTSVALQQSRVRNRRRAPQPARSNYKGGGLKNDERCRIRAEKVVVEIRVVFLKIGEIDTLKELYHADAFIQAKWKEPLLEGRGAEELKSIDLEKYWNPLLYIDNILSETKEATWVVAQHDPLNSDVYIVERRRLKGRFPGNARASTIFHWMSSSAVWRHPQDLTITITSERPDTEIELIPDEAEMSGINIQTFVDQQEWRLHEHIEVEKRTLTQEFSSTMKSHPCLAVRCRAARGPATSTGMSSDYVHDLGPVVCHLAVEPHKCEYRLRLSFTLVLTSVTFKYVVAQSLPRISYLTYMAWPGGAAAALPLAGCWEGAAVLIALSGFCLLLLPLVKEKAAGSAGGLQQRRPSPPGPEIRRRPPAAPVTASGSNQAACDKYVLMSLAILCIVSIWARRRDDDPTAEPGAAALAESTRPTRAETASWRPTVAVDARVLPAGRVWGALQPPPAPHGDGEQDREGRLSSASALLYGWHTSSSSFWLYYDLELWRGV